MADCEYTLQDLLDFEIPTITVDICATAHTIIALAMQHIIKLTMNPCAFDGLEIDGVACDSSLAINRLNALIKCMQNVCKEQSEQECYGYHQPVDFGFRCKGR